MKRIRKSFYGIWDNKVHHLNRIDYSQAGCNGSHAWARAAMHLGPLVNARPDASPASASLHPLMMSRLGKLPESSAQTAGLLMLDPHCLMQIQFDWNNNVAPRSAN